MIKSIPKGILFTVLFGLFAEAALAGDNLQPPQTQPAWHNQTEEGSRSINAWNWVHNRSWDELRGYLAAVETLAWHSEPGQLSRGFLIFLKAARLRLLGFNNAIFLLTNMDRVWSQFPADRQSDLRPALETCLYQIGRQLALANPAFVLWGENPDYIPNVEEVMAFRALQTVSPRVANALIARYPAVFVPLSESTI